MTDWLTEWLNGWIWFNFPKENIKALLRIYTYFDVVREIFIKIYYDDDTLQIKLNGIYSIQSAFAFSSCECECEWNGLLLMKMDM